VLIRGLLQFVLELIFQELLELVLEPLELLQLLESVQELVLELPLEPE